MFRLLTMTIALRALFLVGSCSFLRTCCILRQPGFERRSSYYPVDARWGWNKSGDHQAHRALSFSAVYCCVNFKAKQCNKRSNVSCRWWCIVSKQHCWSCLQPRWCQNCQHGSTATNLSHHPCCSGLEWPLHLGSCTIGNMYYMICVLATALATENHPQHQTAEQ